MNNETLETVIEKTIGNLIKEKCEEKNLTLKVISQQTKIHISLLEYLEIDRLDKLPSKTYVRGFIKSVAKVLSINQEVALSALDYTYELNSSKKKEEKIIAPKKAASEEKLRPIGHKSIDPSDHSRFKLAFLNNFIKIGFGLLILGLIGLNLKNYIEKGGDESKIKLPEVLSTIQPKKRPAPKVITPPKVLAPEDEAKKLAPIQINLIPEKKEILDKKEIVLKDVTLHPVSIAEKQFSIDNTTKKEDLSTIFPDKYRVQLVKGTENIFINATDGDSWITYKIDDREIKKFVLRQGRTLFLRGKLIRLFIGNTKNLKIIYNNQLINIEHAKSTIKNLVFPESFRSKYLNPLFVFQKDGSVSTSDEVAKSKESGPMAPSHDAQSKSL